MKYIRLSEKIEVIKIQTMFFTYKAYEELVSKCVQGGYKFVGYDYTPTAEERVVILRHDIDYNIDKSCRLAKLEQQLGVKSTYFVLVSSDLYNVFSKRSSSGLQMILDCGHEIGLHFDEHRYSDIMGNPAKCAEHILQEVKALENAIRRPVTKFSFHLPSQEILQLKMSIPGMVNSYAPTFFSEYTYISDSRHRWRSPVLDIIDEGNAKHLHILTHAFWYNEREESIHDTVNHFINNANKERYAQLSEGITDIHGIMPPEEVL